MALPASNPDSMKALSPIGGSTKWKASERPEDDYYATDPLAVELLIKQFPVLLPKSVPVLEPAAGAGHLSKKMIELGLNVSSFDIHPKDPIVKPQDFFKTSLWNGNIVTNPPYSIEGEFIAHAYDILQEGCLAAFFLPVRFLAGKNHWELFRKRIGAPKSVLVFPKRISCAKNGDFSKVEGSAIDYAWMIWIKSQLPEMTSSVYWFSLPY